MSSKKNCENIFVKSFDKSQRQNAKRLFLLNKEYLENLIKFYKIKDIDGNSQYRLREINLEYIIKDSKSFIETFKNIIDKKKSLGIDSKSNKDLLKVTEKELIQYQKEIKDIQKKLLNAPQQITEKEKEEFKNALKRKIELVTNVCKQYKSGETLLAKEEISDIFCNSECKGTIFEAGDKLSDEYKKKIIQRFVKEGKNKTRKIKITKEEKENIIKDAETRREYIFGEKKNVIKNGFFMEIDKNSKKMLEQMGAISGCYEGIFYPENVLYSMK